MQIYTEFSENYTVEDIYWEMSDKEKQDMLELLNRDHFTLESVHMYEPKRPTLRDTELSNCLSKIADNRLTLSTADQSLIKKIADSL